MTIVDMALRACWNCKATWLEDDRMYEDPNRCPHCGLFADQRPGSDLHGGGGSAPLGDINNAGIWDDAGGIWDDSSGEWEDT